MEKKTAEEIEKVNREHFAHKRRLKILEMHLGSDFYKIGEYHNNISDAMEEYASQFQPQEVGEEITDEEIEKDEKNIGTWDSERGQQNKIFFIAGMKRMRELMKERNS